MKQLIFALYDIKADMYLNPQFFVTKGQALRALSDIASDKNTMVGQHPADYILTLIGTYDTLSGIIEGTLHENLGVAKDFVVNKE